MYKQVIIMRESVFLGGEGDSISIRIEYTRHETLGETDRGSERRKEETCGGGYKKQKNEKRK